MIDCYTTNNKSFIINREITDFEELLKKEMLILKAFPGFNSSNKKDMDQKLVSIHFLNDTIESILFGLVECTNNEIIVGLTMPIDYHESILIMNLVNFLETHLMHINITKFTTGPFKYLLKVKF